MQSPLRHRHAKASQSAPPTRPRSAPQPLRTAAWLGAALLTLSWGCASPMPYQGVERIHTTSQDARGPIEGAVYDESEMHHNRFVVAKLLRPVLVDAVHQPLSQVLASITEQTEQRIHVNWGMLRAAGVFEDTPVTVYASEASGADALNLVVHEVNNQALKPVAFAVVDGLVVVSTQEHFALLRRYKVGRGR